MIRRVTLENFMSHKRTVIDLAPGITVLLGPNNCGKSALVAGLMTVCRNDAGSYAVRHGQKVSRVTVETDEGNSVTWERKVTSGGGTVSYEVDGKRIDRVRGDVPAEAAAVLRMPEARDDNDVFEIHFGCQKEPIFLLNDKASGRRAAQFLGLSSDAGKLLEMQRLHSARTAERQRTRSRLADEMAQLDHRLNVLVHLEDVRGPLGEAERLYAGIAAREQKARELEQLLTSMRHALHEERGCALTAGALASVDPPPAQGSVDALQAIVIGLQPLLKACAWGQQVEHALQSIASPPSQQDIAVLRRVISGLRDALAALEAPRMRVDVLSQLTDVPSQHETQDLAGLMRALRASRTATALVQERSAALELLAEPPALGRVGALGATCEALATQENALDHLAEVVDALSPLQSPPSALNPAPLSVTLAMLAEVTSEVAQLVERGQLLTKLAEPPAPADTRVLRERLAMLRDAGFACAQASASLSDCEREVEAVLSEIRTWAGENPRCPKCGGDVDPDRLVVEHEGHHA